MGRLLYSALIGLSVPAVFPGPYPVPFLRIVRCLRRAAPSPLIVLFVSSSYHYTPLRVPPLRAGPGSSPVAAIPALRLTLSAVFFSPAPYRRPSTHIPPPLPV